MTYRVVKYIARLRFVPSLRLKYTLLQALTQSYRLTLQIGFPIPWRSIIVRGFSMDLVMKCRQKIKVWSVPGKFDSHLLFSIFVGSFGLDGHSLLVHP